MTEWTPTQADVEREYFNNRGCMKWDLANENVLRLPLREPLANIISRPMANYEDVKELRAWYAEFKLESFTHNHTNKRRTLVKATVPGTNISFYIDEI